MTISIRGSQIKDNTITSGNLATGIIDNSNLLGSSVVTSAAINNDAIVSAKIADGAIDSAAYLANAVVTAAKIDLTGTFNFASGTVSVATPTADAHAASKAYVDSTAQGVHWKESAICASVANVDITSAPSAIDGVTLTSGDRIVLKDQTDASECGFYSFASAGAALTRTDDANTAAKLEGAAIFVRQGSSHADQGFIVTTDNITLGSTDIVISQFTGLASISAGDGLTKAGSTISVDLSSNPGLEFASGELQVKAGNGVELQSGSLQVKLNGSTLSLGASGLSVGTITSNEMGSNSVTGAAIADGAIGDSGLFGTGVVNAAAIGTGAVTSAKLGSASVATAKIQDAAVDENKLAGSVAGNGLSGGAGSALSVAVDDSTTEISGGNVIVKNGGITNAKLSSDSVDTSQLIADSVTAAKIGAAFYQEVFQVSGSSTSSIDLARSLDTGFFSSAMVFKNGLNLLNMTALSDSAANNDEYTIANNGAGSVGRLSFGGNLDNGDAVLVVYFT